ncbi:MAG TPA: polyketide synthase dehydratase domain-containing protein, partial [Pyrinomonadaceae bacterium]
MKLPAYPWQHQRYWVEAKGGSLWGRVARFASAGGHPLLGRRMQSALKHVVFETVFSAEAPHYLDHHRIDGALGSTIVVPGSSHISMALSAAREVFGADTCRVEGVTFFQALTVPDEESRSVQLILTPNGPLDLSFQIFSRAEESQDQDAWLLHASGTLKKEETDSDVAAGAQPSFETAEGESYEQLSGAQFYQDLWALGYHLGPSFRWLDEVRRGRNEALCRMRLPEGADRVDDFQLHPGVIDSCFQLLGMSLPPEMIADWVGNDAIYVPLKVEGVRFHGRASGQLQARATLRAEATEEAEARRREELIGDISLFDADGRLVAEIEGLYVKRVNRSALMQVEQGPQDWVYELTWRGADPVAEPAAEGSAASDWLILADGGGVADALRSSLPEGARAFVATPGSEFRRLSGDAYELDPSSPEQFRQLLGEASSVERPLRVIHLWGLDVRDAADDGAGELMRGQQHGCGSLLHLAQAMSAERGTARLWVVTRGAQSIDGEVQPEGEATGEQVSASEQVEV